MDALARYRPAVVTPTGSRVARPRKAHLCALVGIVAAFASLMAEGVPQQVQDKHVRNAVRRVNSLLESWSGTMLGVFFPESGPTELTINVDAYPDPLQMVVDQAAIGNISFYDTDGNLLALVPAGGTLPR